MREIRLPLPSHAYRFDLLLEFVKRIAYPARMVARDDMLWRYTDGQLLSYQQAGDTIVARGKGLSAANEAQIRQASRRVLGLDRDLSAFYRFAQAEEQLWPVIGCLQGMPIFCSETVFEALITLIIEQHITWKTALRSQRSLMEVFGCGALVGDKRVFDFPTAQLLSPATLEQLKVLKITNGRIALIIRISQGVCRGELDLESLSHKTPQEAYKWLLRIKGVGHWTASNVVGRALGEYPYVSQNDVALQAAIHHYFFAGKGIKSAQQVTEALADFGEYAGMAGHLILLRWVMDRYPVMS